MLLATLPLFMAADVRAQAVKPAKPAKAAPAKKATPPSGDPRAATPPSGDPRVAALAKATNPATCLQGTQEYVFGLYKAAEAAKHPIGSDSLEALARDFASRCADKVAAHAPNDQLGFLAQLYKLAGRKALADSTVARSLAVAKTPQERAAALMLAAMSTTDRPEVEARFSSALDSMPDDALPFKFQLHSGLLAQYRHEDNDAAISRHARAVIAIVPSVPAGAHGNKELEEALVVAYKNLAEVLADDGHADSSLAVLARAEQDLSWVKNLEEQLKEPKLRYSLVGKPAPMIDGKRWFNAPPGTSQAPITGKVGVVQLTATWCPPCKRSYPELRTISEKYAGKPVQVVLHTTLYGTFEGRDVNDAEEIAADSGYYAQVQRLAVPIGLQVDHLKHDSTGKMVFEDAVDERYGVTDIPTTVIIDQAGVVRRILTGWDAGNAGRITESVDQLLAEKPRT
jgi:thiol-disulfide isomerase/thioredoxin